MNPLMRTHDLSLRYPSGMVAVKNLNIQLYPGECYGLVGESGCGKTSLSRLICGLREPSSGKLFYKDEILDFQNKKKWKEIRSEIQMIFQDPYGSLDPRMTILSILEEPLKNFGIPKKKRKERIEQVLEEVSLKKDCLNRFPHEFSGGQRQRIAIARAIAPKPKLLICDEPVSALDVSVQAQILELLQQLREKEGLTMLFVSHDLAVVKFIADRVGVMYEGSIVEEVKVEALPHKVEHSYTIGLVNAVPEIGEDWVMGMRKNPS